MSLCFYPSIMFGTFLSHSSTFSSGTCLDSSLITWLVIPCLILNLWRHQIEILHSFLMQFLLLLPYKWIGLQKCLKHDVVQKTSLKCPLLQKIYLVVYVISSNWSFYKQLTCPRLISVIHNCSQSWNSTIIFLLIQI